VARSCGLLRRPETRKRENGLRTPALRTCSPSAAPVTPNQVGASLLSRALGDLRSAVAVAVAFDGCREPYAEQQRFSDFGFTKSRMARKIVGESRERISAPDRAAYCGFNLFSLGHSCFQFAFQNSYFTASSRACSNRRNDWGEKDNRPICTGSASERLELGAERKEVKKTRSRLVVSSLTRACRMNTWVELRKGKAASTAALQRGPVGAGATAVRCLRKTKIGNFYMSSGANWEKASGAASSNRVRRLAEDEADFVVGPFALLAT